MNIDAEFQALGHSPIERLLNMMKRLRDPITGCPWDREQDFASIAPYTIEEAYEVSDAIDRGDMADLRQELGDLLLQVVFHAQMANELDLFSFEDISDGLVKKMIARHPHVFGEGNPQSKQEQTNTWEEIKAKERSHQSQSRLLDGVALALPALMRAEKLQNRAARVGFDWPDARQILDKVAEESLEVVEAVDNDEPQSRIHEEMGDLLFVVTNLARKLDVDAEHALRDANQKFTRRFTYIEDHANKPLSDMDLQEMEDLWEESKAKGL